MGAADSKRAVWAGVIAGALVITGVSGWAVNQQSGTEQRLITVGTTDRVTSVDPAGAHDPGSWRLISNVFQSLMTFTPGSAQPAPDAAEQCRFTNSSLMRYSCTLRRGLEFSDGSPLTAQDVKHSFDRVLKINHPRGPARVLDTLKEVRVVDGKVEFWLKSPDATFPYKIAGGAGAIVPDEVYPADALLSGNRAVGSGPYVLQSYDPGSAARLAPNGKYRGMLEDRPAHMVLVRYYDRPTELLGAWREKLIDVSTGQLPPEEAAEIKPTDEGIRVYEQSGLGIRSLAFNHRPGSPTAELPVRRAVASLVSRTALAGGVHRHMVEPLYSLIPQGVNGHGAPFHERYGDPDADAAREFLAEAGITEPVRFEIAHSGDAAAAEDAETLRLQLDASGLFRVTVRKYEEEEFRQGVAEGEFDAHLADWFPDFPEADAYTTPLVGTDGVHRTGYGDKEIDKAIDRTRRSYDRTAVIEEFERIDRKAATEVPLLPLWQEKEHVVSKDDISGVQYLTDNSGVWRLWELDRF
ncbi:peptide-binding protein [Streptomyces carminius]|uniref:Peptide-binding protein n=1 Tax=Streptomyces carminius TaxID=2665496 RepID=A0A2M8LS90_9ACTN|nr:ABC transporter substrate-binding protein [Streptomyces carminius]PJE94804.1 peptide-binding protein [Streptomyces carminius]